MYVYFLVGVGVGVLARLRPRMIALGSLHAPTSCPVQTPTDERRQEVSIRRCREPCRLFRSVPTLCGICPRSAKVSRHFSRFVCSVFVRFCFCFVLRRIFFGAAWLDWSLGKFVFKFKSFYIGGFPIFWGSGTCKFRSCSANNCLHLFSSKSEPGEPLWANLCFFLILCVLSLLWKLCRKNTFKQPRTCVFQHYPASSQIFWKCRRSRYPRVDVPLCPPHLYPCVSGRGQTWVRWDLLRATAIPFLFSVSLFLFFRFLSCWFLFFILPFQQFLFSLFPPF